MISVSLIIFAFFINAFYQGDEWEKTYGGDGIDVGCSIQQTIDGYIIGGYTNSFSKDDDFDMWVLKIDSNGNEEWNATYGSNKDEECRCIRQTKNGYILVGSKRAEEESHIWVVKIDDNGNEEWNRTYGNWSMGRYIEATKDGGYIIVGWESQEIYRQSDVLLIKIDSEGNIEWSKIYEEEDYQDGIIVHETDDGYIIGGNTGFEHQKAMVIKVDRYGEIEWKRTYNGIFSSLEIVDDGYLIVGSIRKWNAWYCYTHSDIWVLKIDSMGNIEWEKSFGTFHHENGQYGEQASNGFIILGETYRVRSKSNFNIYGTWLIKIDEDSKEEWIRRIEGVSGMKVLFSHDAFILLGIRTYYNHSDACVIKMYEPALRIEAIKTSIGHIFIDARNIGSKELSNINWTIYLEGMVFCNRYMQGNISIPVNESVTIGSDTIIGIGPVSIVITIGNVAKILHFFLLGPIFLPYYL